MHTVARRMSYTRCLAIIKTNGLTRPGIRLAQRSNPAPGESRTSLRPPKSKFPRIPSSHPSFAQNLQTMPISPKTDLSKLRVLCFEIHEDKIAPLPHGGSGSRAPGDQTILFTWTVGVSFVSSNLACCRTPMILITRPATKAKSAFQKLQNSPLANITFSD